MVGSLVACIPTMPNPPTHDYINNHFNKMQSGTSIDAFKVQLQEDSAACAERLHALVGKAKNQRNWGNTLAFLFAGGTSLSGGVSAVANDETTKKATAIGAAVGGVLTVGAGFIGNPSDTLVIYSRSQAEYDNAVAIANYLSIGMPGWICTEPTNQDKCEKEKNHEYDKKFVDMLNALKKCAGREAPQQK